MDIQKLTIIFRLAIGVFVLIFGCVAALGMLSNIPPSRSIILFILGAIIVLWALSSMRKTGK
ncbi:MAG: hypothetical protein Q4C46_02455 [Bacillota bacterium]|nr:hypothetical protein [Bacillota bacterium]